MLKGWKIFKYSRKINSSNDFYSHCKINISKYNQSLFKNEDSLLNFYSSPSKSLELILFKDSFEIRMFDWKQNETRMIILDKIYINKNERSNYTDRTFFIKEGASWMIFYKSEELNEFIRNLAEDRDNISDSLYHVKTNNYNYEENAYLYHVKTNNDDQMLPGDIFQNKSAYVTFINGLNSINSGDDQYVCPYSPFIEELNKMIGI